MKQELPPLTLEDYAKSSAGQDDFLTKMRGLNPAVKNASSQDLDWTTNVMQPLSLDYGNIIGGATIMGATGSTGSSAGITYTNTTSPYTIGSGTYGPSNGNVSIANTQFDQHGKMTLKGTNADIEINGKSMTAWMEKVEERLNILTPNTELEKDWDDLRRLGERYRKLEKKCQEKAQMWEALKKLPRPKL